VYPQTADGFHPLALQHYVSGWVEHIALREDLLYNTQANHRFVNGIGSVLYRLSGGYRHTPLHGDILIGKLRVSQSTQPLTAGPLLYYTRQTQTVRLIKASGSGWLAHTSDQQTLTLTDLSDWQLIDDPQIIQELLWQPTA